MKVLALISVLFLAANALPFGDVLEQSKDFDGDIWVVLVAGSNTWDNYRHQVINLIEITWNMYSFVFDYLLRLIYITLTK